MASPITTKPTMTEPTGAKPVDEDIAVQALPGHGVPSQDPDPAAQVLLGPEETERESKSVLAGGGAVAGIATGAAIGGAVGGPVGIVVGATLGTVAGALAGAAAAVTSNATELPNASAPKPHERPSSPA
jgi:hypothetical protein